MEYNEIIKIIRQTAIDNACTIEVRDSLSTNSHYFKLKSGKNSMLFRISDHPSNCNIKTLRVDKMNNKESIINFTKNCCNGLAHRAFKAFMYK